jgi:hypothetical protein
MAEPERNYYEVLLRSTGEISSIKPAGHTWTEGELKKGVLKVEWSEDERNDAAEIIYDTPIEGRTQIKYPHAAKFNGNPALLSKTETNSVLRTAFDLRT